MEFRNKVALVSGAANGIGREVSKALNDLGAIVIGLDLEFEESWNSSDDGIIKMGVDISDYKSVNEIVNLVESKYGSIEFLANVAGILKIGKLLEMSIEDWELTFSVNTIGAFNLCRGVASKMAERKRGSIVAVGSNAASTPRFGMGCYAASKAGLTQFIKCLGLELAPLNIRCNIVSPGSTNTKMQRDLWSKENGEQDIIDGNLSQFRLGIPLRRIAQPSQISDLIIFLLSNKSSHITMENIIIDGGATLGG